MSHDRKHEFEPHQQVFLDQIAAIFRTFREQAGLTHKQASAFVPMTTGRISSIENAKNDVRLLSLQKWANAYGYNVEIAFVPFEEEEDGTSAEHLSALPNQDCLRMDDSG